MIGWNKGLVATSNALLRRFPHNTKLRDFLDDFLDCYLEDRCATTRNGGAR